MTLNIITEERGGRERCVVRKVNVLTCIMWELTSDEDERKNQRVDQQRQQCLDINFIIRTD